VRCAAAGRERRAMIVYRLECFDPKSGPRISDGGRLAGGSPSGNRIPGELPPSAASPAAECSANHAAEARNALAGGVLVGEGEAEPNRIGAGSVSVERFAGHKGDPCRFEGTRQQVCAVQALRQCHPDEHAALGPGPFDAGRHVLGKRGQDEIAALSVCVAQHCSMAVVTLLGNPMHDDLVDRGAVQVRRLLHQHQFADNRLRRADPADPQAGRQRLGEGAAIDCAGVVDAAGAVAVHRQDWRNRLAS